MVAVSSIRTWCAFLSVIITVCHFQGYESRWINEFPGAGPNGLLDLQNMLKGQIDVVEELLKEANKAFVKAEVTANQLQAEGRLLSR